MYDNNEELDLDTWADDAAATGTEVYFKRQPVPPSSGKWEKLVPGIMWMVNSNCPGCCSCFWGQLSERRLSTKRRATLRPGIWMILLYVLIYHGMKWRVSATPDWNEWFRTCGKSMC